MRKRQFIRQKSRKLGLFVLKCTECNALPTSYRCIRGKDLLARYRSKLAPFYSLILLQIPTRLEKLAENSTDVASEETIV